MPSPQCSTSHQTRLQPGRSTTDWKVGLRHDQEVHSRLTADASTTPDTHPNRREHTETGPRSDDKVLQASHTYQPSQRPVLTTGGGTPSVDGTTAHPPSKSHTTSRLETGASSASAMPRFRRYRRSIYQTRTRTIEYNYTNLSRRGKKE